MPPHPPRDPHPITVPPGDRLHRTLLVLWVATMGADRIDLAGGRTGFAFTPFLALTPLVVLSELVRRHAWRREIRIARPTIAFLTLLLALLAVVLASVFVSLEASTSAARVTLLVIQIFGALGVVLSAADRDDLPALLARGAAYGLLLFFLFDLMEIAAWVGASATDAVHLGPVDVRLETSAYAGIFPRLCGQVLDPNRAGFLVLFYAYLVVKGERSARWRRALVVLTVALLVLSLSRSAFVAALTASALAALERGELRARPGSWATAALAVAAVCVFLLIAPETTERLLTALVPFTQRLSTAEGSSQGHMELITRGIAAATESVPRALLGLGYGSSYTILQDIFPGNRYGNFHSLYVSMFAESGVFALVLTLVLLVVPLVRGGPYRALVAGALVFNIFYQATAEPAFWVTLTLAWLPFHMGRVPHASRSMRVLRPASRG